MAEKSLPRIELKAVYQIAIVVRDIKKTMENYWKTFGIGPWAVHDPWRYPDLWGLTYRGKPSQFIVKCAFAMIGPTEIELIEPVTSGDNVYHDFLEEQGEGIHHLLFEVNDVDKTIEEMGKGGFALLQSGHVKDGHFAYFDTTASLGAIWEVARLPKEDLEPDYFYP